jgi:hypothetical protein
LHLVDTFAIGSYQRVSFTLAQDSLLRMHTNGDDARIQLRGDQFRLLTDGVDTSDANGIYARLGAGNYTLTVPWCYYVSFRMLLLV